MSSDANNEKSLVPIATTKSISQQFRTTVAYVGAYSNLGNPQLQRVEYGTPNFESEPYAVVLIPPFSSDETTKATTTTLPALENVTPAALSADGTVALAHQPQVHGQDQAPVKVKVSRKIQKTENKFLCPHPGCNRTFMNGRGILSHQVIHSREINRIKCKFCSASYIYKKCLINHNDNCNRGRNYRQARVPKPKTQPQPRKVFRSGPASSGPPPDYYRSAPPGFRYQSAPPQTPVYYRSAQPGVHYQSATPQPPVYYRSATPGVHYQSGPPQQQVYYQSVPPPVCSCCQPVYNPQYHFYSI